MYEPISTESHLKANNLILAEENITLRQNIALLRNERIQMNRKLLEAIGAKESFKIEVIKLITNVQNAFERLKTFIEHTTSTPPPKLQPSSSRQKLLNGLTMENLLQQQHQQEEINQRHASLQDIPTFKDTKQQNKDINNNELKKFPPTNSSASAIPSNEIQIMEKEIRNFVTNCQSNNPKVLNRKFLSPPSKNSVATASATNTTTIGDGNRRCSMRLKSNVSVQLKRSEGVSDGNGKQNPTRKDNEKENIKMACAFKDITNETRMRLGQAQNQAGLHLPSPTPSTSRGRKRKIIV